MLIFILSIFFSLFISLIWTYYLRKIDLFENEEKWHLFLVFVLSAVFPFLILLIHHFIFTPLRIHTTGNLLDDFIFYTFGVGLLEETVKFLPVLIILKFFKKAGNEPIDYIIFSSVSALGFSFHENISYVDQYGLGVLCSRSVLSVPSHMFDSALFVYGIVLSTFHNTKLGKWNIPLFILFASLSHGFYDFWLSIEGFNFGILITILYFFLTISIFSTILNNCMNNSPFYTPKKTIDSEKLITHLSIFYLVLLVAIIVAESLLKDFAHAMGFAFYFVLFRMLILGILIVRLSRFKIIPGRWNKIKFELPFSVISVAYTQTFQGGTTSRSGLRIKVKGESVNEIYLNAFYEEHFELVPVSLRRTFIKKTQVAFMERKLFLKNDETFYLLKVFIEINPDKCIYFLLKAKTNGTSRTPQNYPIAALLKITDPQKLSDETSSEKDFPFLEWVILKPLKN